MLKINEPISVYDSDARIELSTGVYRVRVLGGWGVKVGSFELEIRNIKNDRIISPKLTKWRIQSYYKRRRAKKIFSLDIPERGEYLISFKKQEDLQVRPSNLFLTKFIEKPIPNSELEIIIG